MNEAIPATPAPEPGSQLAALARAVRFAFAASAAGISYPNFRLAIHIPHFGQVFHDMLGGKPLPAITAWVIHVQTYLLLFSVLIPIVALLSACIARPNRSIYISTILLLIAIAQFSFTSYALWSPFVTILSNLQGTPP